MHYSWLKTHWRSASTIFRYLSFRDSVYGLAENSEDLMILNKSKSLAGKRVAYVGGYGDIGYHCCKNLLQDGIQHLVVLDAKENHRKRRCLQLINQTIKFDFVELNLCDEKEAITEALKETVKHMGQIDILVNGSGVLNESDPALSVNVNLTGLVETTLAAIPLMSKMEGGKGGLIVNVACMYDLEPAAYAAVYTATKHAVIGFTRSLAHNINYIQTKIRYAAVCPGSINTSMFPQTPDSHLTPGLPLPPVQTLNDTVAIAETQTANTCGTALANTIRNAENGDVFIIKSGCAKKVRLKKYW